MQLFGYKIPSLKQWEYVWKTIADLLHKSIIVDATLNAQHKRLQLLESPIGVDFAWLNAKASQVDPIVKTIASQNSSLADHNIRITELEKIKVADQNWRQLQLARVEPIMTDVIHIKNILAEHDMRLCKIYKRLHYVERQTEINHQFLKVAMTKVKPKAKVKKK